MIQEVDIKVHLPKAKDKAEVHFFSFSPTYSQICSIEYGSAFTTNNCHTSLRPLECQGRVNFDEGRLWTRVMELREYLENHLGKPFKLSIESPSESNKVNAVATLAFRDKPNTQNIFTRPAVDLYCIHSKNLCNLDWQNVYHDGLLTSLSTLGPLNLAVVFNPYWMKDLDELEDFIDGHQPFSDLPVGNSPVAEMIRSFGIHTLWFIDHRIHLNPQLLGCDLERWAQDRIVFHAEGQRFVEVRSCDVGRFWKFDSSKHAYGNGAHCFERHLSQCAQDWRNHQPLQHHQDQFQVEHNNEQKTHVLACLPDFED